MEGEDFRPFDKQILDGAYPDGLDRFAWRETEQPRLRTKIAGAGATGGGIVGNRDDVRTRCRKRKQKVYIPLSFKRHDIPQIKYRSRHRRLIVAIDHDMAPAVTHGRANDTDHVNIEDFRRLDRAIVENTDGNRLGHFAWRKADGLARKRCEVGARSRRCCPNSVVKGHSPDAWPVQRHRDLDQTRRLVDHRVTHA